MPVPMYAQRLVGQATVVLPPPEPGVAPTPNLRKREPCRTCGKRGIRGIGRAGAARMAELLSQEELAEETARVRQSLAGESRKGS